MSEEKRKAVEKEVRSLIMPLEVRAESNAEGKKVIVGYAAIYNSPTILRDWWGEEFLEEIAQGAFDTSLKEDNIRALYNHNPDHILGSTKSGTLVLSSDTKGLRFENYLPNTQVANDLYENVSRGDVDGNSFGFKVRKDQWSKVEHDGKEMMKRTLVDVKLIEISPTPFPAYEDTEVDCRSLEKIKLQETGLAEKRSLEKELLLLELDQY